MKKGILIIAFILPFLGSFAQWEPTYILEHNTINQGSPVYSACIHNGSIYAATNVPAQNQLWRSSDHGETWEEVNYPEHVGWFSHMVSVDDRLYIANYNNWYAKSTIWYSTDEGQNWTIDTAGMPGAGGANGGAYVIEMHGWKGHLIATFGGADLFYMKAFDEPWQLVEELVPTDPNVYDHRGDTIFAVHKYSPDFGQTWIQPTNNGLPGVWAPSALCVTPTRIYMSGDNLGNKMLIYSDDSGENWNTIDLGQWTGRTVWSIHAIGDQLWLGLDNDAVGSTTDVIYSANGGSSFADDSEGLPDDPYGTYQIHTFMHDDADIYAVNNFLDIYRRGLESSGITSKNTRFQMQVYPNPAKDKLSFELKNEEKYRQVIISDIMGKEMTYYNAEGGNSIPVSDLKPGFYFLLVETPDGEIYQSGFIKQ